MVHGGILARTQEIHEEVEQQYNHTTHQPRKLVTFFSPITPTIEGYTSGP